MLIAESPPYEDNPLPGAHPRYELAEDPRFGLLNYWYEPDGRHRVLVNPGYQRIIEDRLTPEIPVYDSNGWRELALAETLRLAIKVGKPVICPFLHWEGVTCNRDCPIRNTVVLIQKHTELANDEAVCTLS
jgi:hypothetical protein